jgi:hypothetical protein
LDKIVDASSLKEWIAEELREPHNIEVLIYKSLTIKDIDPLLERVKESKEILKAFKDEIERYTLKEKIFIYLCYIFQGWEGLKHFKRSFPKVTSLFSLSVDEYDIDGLLNKFDFRVETYEDSGGLRIKFSHPDFSKAVEETFEGNADVISRILGEMVRDVDKYVRGKVAWTVGDNFDTLPEDCRNLLTDLAKDEDSYVRERVALTVGENFDILDKDYRRLLFTLSEDKAAEVRRNVALVVGRKFEDLHPEYQGILKKFKSDAQVLELLRESMEAYEEHGLSMRATKTLKQELDI